ncbi:MAG: methionine--tRNA ligase [Firmicutes bacterium]|nr:methionine--tRNA ligase [Bacillota bacterium]
MAKFYLTTAIDYVNGEPHLGHAYEKIAADVIARFKRLAGYDTFFLTGTDEHSLNVARKAHAEGMSPKEFCDRMVASFKRAWEKLGIKYDRFIRTTDEDHVATVRDIVRRANDRGYIYQGTYSGWYCVSCEAFLSEGQLVDGRCPLHPSRKVEWVEEKNYFFALSKFQDALLDHIEKHPEFILPETRCNEIVNRIREGLQDVSISRSTVEWGIPLPMDPGQVVYVWFDALINYLTGAGYASYMSGMAGDVTRGEGAGVNAGEVTGAAGPGEPGESREFERWWPADLHIIGKDITWFHCVIWPATLMAAGLPLPGTVFGHGFVNIGGARMSKSEGTVVDPIKLADEYGADALRYYLMRDIQFGRDGDFTIDGLRERYNSDLANDLGNLLNRTVAMTERFLGGVVPAPGASDGRDDALVANAMRAARAAREKMEALDFSGAIADIWTIVDDGNKYIDEKAPWTLARSETMRDALNTVMYNLVEALRVTAIMVSPFIPGAARKIWDQLGLDGSPEGAGWASALEWGKTTPGTRIRRGDPIFPRLERQVAAEAGGAGSEKEGPGKTKTAQTAKTARNANGGEKKVAEGQASEQASEGVSKIKTGVPGTETPGTGLITIDQFAQVNLRVARVVDARKVEGADKLLQLEVDLGTEKRQIVAGIAKHYSPEELVGKEIVVVANLQPARLRGILSQGMLLAAVSQDGERVVVLTPDKEIEPGAKVR